MSDYREYIRIEWPDYQDLMEEHSDEWAEEVVAIGMSDVLVPAQWVGDFYDRDKIENLLFKFAEDHALTSTKGEIDEFNEWIKQNL